MKILQVIPYFCFGGAETMCENLTYALIAQGHDVCVVSLYPERTPIAQRMEKAGVRIRYLDKKLGLDMSMVPKLMAIMKEEKPDAVHTHLDVIKYAVAAAKLCGIKKCVHTVHNVAEKEAEGRVQKLINGFYFRLGWSVPVALSPQVQETIVDFYGLPKGKVPVIFNGVDLSRCIPKESYEAGERTKLVHIGRFNEQKNHRRVLEAFSLFVKKYPCAELWLLGDGELMESTKAYAKDLSLEEKVAALENFDVSSIIISVLPFSSAQSFTINYFKSILAPDHMTSMAKSFAIQTFFIFESNRLPIIPPIAAGIA